jgi:hypothetical protein
MGQQFIAQTGSGTDMLAAVGQVSIVLEAIVLWACRATLPLVAASFSLGQYVVYRTAHQSSGQTTARGNDARITTLEEDC